MKKTWTEKVHANYPQKVWYRPNIFAKIKRKGLLRILAAKRGMSNQDYLTDIIEKHFDQFDEAGNLKG